MLTVFCQHQLYLYFSDQTEKLLSSIQAMIEFNCFASKDMDKVPAPGQKAFFEAFWDSEVPRYEFDFKRLINFMAFPIQFINCMLIVSASC